MDIFFIRMFFVHYKNSESFGLLSEFISEGDAIYGYN